MPQAFTYRFSKPKLFLGDGREDGAFWHLFRQAASIGRPLFRRFRGHRLFVRQAEAQVTITYGCTVSLKICGTILQQTIN